MKIVSQKNVTLFESHHPYKIVIKKASSTKGAFCLVKQDQRIGFKSADLLAEFRNMLFESFVRLHC